MAINVFGDTVIQCCNCNKTYSIGISSFEKESYVYKEGTEDGMGAEISHEFYSCYVCDKCQNEMEVLIRAFEYPVDVLSYFDSKSSDCVILKEPEILIDYYNESFTDYDLGKIYQDIDKVNTIINRVLRDKNELYTLTPREFEELVAEIFRQQGHIVELTPKTRDGGYDMMATKTIGGISYASLIECKRYNPENPVGVHLVRSLRGVLADKNVNKGILVITSRFTKDAIKFAENQAYLISLIDGEALYNMILAQNAVMPFDLMIKQFN
ncbi:MAG: restriction endonuclease [Veillonella sp.]|uniref:restriction endonuclease n=1 Tax=Veillonella sp. TaxID=1926307 RepID=UPI0025F49120|nr:restriction endonuclease [Veillonella sp.]MBS4912590.1 restriction endonuclease [Veillonella sp.]